MYQQLDEDEVPRVNLGRRRKRKKKKKEEEWKGDLEEAEGGAEKIEMAVAVATRMKDRVRGRGAVLRGPPQRIRIRAPRTTRTRTRACRECWGLTASGAGAGAGAGVLIQKKGKGREEGKRSGDGGSERKRDDQALTSAAISFLKGYKQLISPLLPPSCRYIPTCSIYSIEAFQEYGFAKGVVLTAFRLFRCAPWGGTGYDPPTWPPVWR